MLKIIYNYGDFIMKIKEFNDFFENKYEAKIRLTVDSEHLFICTNIVLSSCYIEDNELMLEDIDIINVYEFKEITSITRNEFSTGEEPDFELITSNGVEISIALLG